MEAAECVTSPEAQVDLALTDGLMPSSIRLRSAGVKDGSTPRTWWSCSATSVDQGGPRPKSAFYGLVSSAIQSAGTRPLGGPGHHTEGSADFLQAVLKERHCCDHRAATAARTEPATQAVDSATALVPRTGSA